MAVAIAKGMKMESMKRKLYFPDRRPGLLLIRLHHQEGEERKPVTLTRYVYFPVMSSSEKTRSLPFPFEKESQFWLLSTHQKRVKIVKVIHDVLEQDTMDPIVQKVLSIFLLHLLHLLTFQSLHVHTLFKCKRT